VIASAGVLGYKLLHIVATVLVSLNMRFSNLKLLLLQYKNLIKSTSLKTNLVYLSSNTAVLANSITKFEAQNLSLADKPRYCLLHRQKIENSPRGGRSKNQGKSRTST